VEEVGQEAWSVVGDHAANHDAEALEVSRGLGQEVGRRDSLLVRIHGREGDARVVVDGDVEELPSRAAGLVAASVFDSLARWRRETPYAAPKDWVFASPRMKEKKPYWGNNLVANHLRVAAEQAGITGTVGWHTFRRSISTWLIDNDENVKVTQELMRHSHSKTTLDILRESGNAIEASGTREDCRRSIGRCRPQREPGGAGGNYECGLSVGYAFSGKSRKSLRMWWPETGSVSRAASGICNLQILKGTGRAKSARMPKRSCKSLAKFPLVRLPRSFSRPCLWALRHANTWFAFTANSRATRATDAPGVSVASTIRRFCSTGI
jgi:Phage integrase family